MIAIGCLLILRVHLEIFLFIFFLVYSGMWFPVKLHNHLEGLQQWLFLIFVVIYLIHELFGRFLGCYTDQRIFDA